MRKIYLDNLRSLIVILIVIFHVIMIFSPIIPNVVGSFSSIQYQDIYMYLLYPWCMIILFIVSGMSSRFYLSKHSIKEFIKSRTVKLLVPSTIALFVFHWITGYYNMLVAGTFDNISPETPAVLVYIAMAIKGRGVLWYILILWLFSMLLAIFHNFDKGKIYNLCRRMQFPLIIALVIPLWLFGKVLNAQIIPFYRFGLYGFSFLVGYFVFANDEIIKKITKYWVWTTIAMIVLGILYCVIYFGQNFTDAIINRNLFTIVYAWASVLAFFGLMKKFFDKETAFFKFTNKRNFALYVFHYTIVKATAYYIFPISIPIVFKYVIVATTSFAGSYLLYELFSRLPFFRWVLLGISKNS